MERQEGVQEEGNRGPRTPVWVVCSWERRHERMQKHSGGSRGCTTPVTHPQKARRDWQVRQGVQTEAIGRRPLAELRSVDGDNGKLLVR